MNIAQLYKKSPDLSGDLSYRYHSALCYIDLPARDYFTPRVLLLGGIVIEIQTIFRLRLTGNPQLLHIPFVIGSPHRGQFIISPFPALADSPVICILLAGCSKGILHMCMHKKMHMCISPPALGAGSH